MKHSFFILFFLFAFAVHAQLQRNYSSYNVDNGLAQNSVWDAFQDFRGYLWFGTADGINRFDGYKMQHYRTEANDSNSIFGTTGFNFFEDGQQNLWVGHDRGLSLYNRITNTFNNIYKNPNGISIMGLDEEGILWTVCAAKYIYGFDRSTLKIKHRIFINQAWHNSYGSIISAIKIRGNFFIGTNGNKIVLFKPKTRSFTIYSFSHRVSTTLHELSNNRFCSFYNSTATICTVVNDTPIFTVKRYTHADTAGAYFSGGALYNNKLFVGGQMGLFVFDEKTLELEERIKTFTDKGDDSYSYVQTVRIDKSGNILVCTNGAGIYLYSPQKNKFKHFTNRSPQKSLFKAIVTTKDGKIYGGTFSEGITAFNTNGTFKIVSPPVKDRVKTIHGLNKVSEDELLIVSYEDVLKYNINTGTSVALPIDNTYNTTVYPQLQKVNNELWLNRNNTDDAAIVEVFTNKRIVEIANNIITCYKKANNNTVLLGTKTGLILYNLSNQKTTQTEITDFVKSICMTEKGKIYVGTIVGLYVLKQDWTVEEHFSTANGLQNNFIYGVLEDNSGNLWFSHNKGISQFHTTEKTFKHYTVKDGLQSNEFNTGAYYKDEKGLLYFGGVNGINVIDPNHIAQNKNIPQIGINEILVDDIPYKFDTAFNEMHAINVSYLQNTLSFDFSALEFSQPEDNTYRYKMEGYDNNWIESGTKHFARYANLPPGNYVFKIKAANGDGVWNEDPREIFINVKPPYWQTGWFYAMVVVFVLLSIAGAVYVFFRRQRARLKRELELQQKLEEERLRISRDLHDNVGAQLSYLITNVEWMLQHPNRLNEKDEQHRLQEMSEAGRNAILTLRQTIWAISQTSLTIEDFADRFKQFALKMITFNKHIHLQFKEDFTTDSILSPAVALHLFRVCQEAFNNSLKHAQARNIVISFYSNETTTFGYTVSDDGIGFNWEEAKQRGHYGLVNMKARAHEANAEFEINSTIGKGTAITITLK